MSLREARFRATATLLNNGKVLVVGGQSGETILKSAELYDPDTDTWTPAASMNRPRVRHTATLLKNGKVLVIGGYDGQDVIDSFQVYEPETNTWTPAAFLLVSHAEHSATLLNNGKVLVVGEGDSDPDNRAQVYEPDTHSWARVAPTHKSHAGPTATSLNDGRVLIVSGDSAEVYDPDANKWTETPPPRLIRTEHTATLLKTGKVLITGGSDSLSAEVYDPVTNTWPIASFMNTPRNRHTATLLNNGKVLITGGQSEGSATPDTEVYDPATDTWTNVGTMIQPRQWHTATLLDNGKVLIAGGFGARELTSVEMTVPDTLITAAPPNDTRETTATFGFTASETGATFECGLDRGVFKPCASPLVLELPKGAHTFKVRARDRLGHRDFTPASHSWIVDPDEPDTRIDEAPTNPNSQTVATFTFASTESRSSFECSLDEAAFSPCVPPMTYTALDRGAHAFGVRARDAAGNLDSTPAFYRWTIERMPVETRLLSAPGRFSTVAAGSFSFASEPGATFECSLDEAPFRPCDSPSTYSDLSQGPHTFSVRARDASGNVDETPEQHTWRVDTVPPETSFASTPKLETQERVPSFSFSSNEARATFECSLDGAPFEECPEVFPALNDGLHRLVVRARDEAGNLDPNPQEYAWTVDNEAPGFLFLQEPAAGQQLFTSTPQFSGMTAKNAFVTVFIDGMEAGPFQADEGGRWVGRAQGPLPWGEHHISAQAHDGAGNTGVRLSEVSFSTTRRGYYRMGCTASPSAWRGSWPWVFLLLVLLYRRSATLPQRPASG